MTLQPTALTKVCNVCGGSYSYDEAHSCTQGNTKLFLEDQPAPLLDPEALIGATLGGRYRIEDCLSGGGMGVVYRARQLVLDRSVAIKIMVVREPQEEASRKRFLQEAVLASRVHHSNVIETFDFGVLDGGHLYLVMEFLEGQTLRQALSDGPMPPLRACRIAMQISRGLQAVHDEGIVHRDLKPDNIFLLQRDGQQDFVKIVDFGVAKGRTSPNLTQVGMVLGTPQYMSPEQVDGKEPDHRVDQYALGCVLYRMITGALPFDGETTSDILMKHAMEQAVPPRRRRPDLGITGSLDVLVMRMLAKRPDGRYPSMRELERALAQEIEFYVERPDTSHATRLMPLPETRPSRGRLAVFMGLGAGVTLVLLILYLGQERGQTAGASTQAEHRQEKAKIAGPAIGRRPAAKPLPGPGLGPACRVDAPGDSEGGGLFERGPDGWSSLPGWTDAGGRWATQRDGAMGGQNMARPGSVPSLAGTAPRANRPPPAPARSRPVKVLFKVQNLEEVKVSVECTGQSPVLCEATCSFELPDGSRGTCVASAPGSGYRPLSVSFDELRARARTQKGAVTQSLNLKYIRFQ